MQSPLVAFYVALTQPWLTPSATLPYDTVLVNEGAGWSSGTSTFLAPRAGIYFFSQGISVTQSNGACLVLVVNGFCVTTQCIYEMTHDNVETSRSAVMKTLQANDNVKSQVLWASQIYGSSLEQTYLQGFLYAPVNNISAVWSVGRTLGNVLGAIDPVVYDKVFVNQGNAWKPVSNSVVISTQGTYAVDLTAYMCGGNSYSVCSGTGDNDVQVLVNTNIIIELKIEASSWADCITRSRTTAVGLHVGDVLRVRVPTVGSCYNSNANTMHTFTGFLLLPW